MLCKQDDKLKMRNTHISIYEVMERPDGTIKEKVLDTVKECSNADFCLIAARTDSEKKEVAVKIAVQGCNTPFIYDNQRDLFSTAPKSESISQEKCEFTISKEQAKAFFGEEAVLASGRTNKTIVRQIHGGIL